jgi:hypothetical protein
MMSSAMQCAGPATHPGRYRDDLPRSVPSAYAQLQARSGFFRGDHIFGRHRIPTQDWSRSPVGCVRGGSCARLSRQDPAEHGPATEVRALNSTIPRASDLPGRPSP